MSGPPLTVIVLPSPLNVYVAPLWFTTLVPPLCIAPSVRLTSLRVNEYAVLRLTSPSIYTLGAFFVSSLAIAMATSALDVPAISSLSMLADNPPKLAL